MGNLSCLKSESKHRDGKVVAYPMFIAGSEQTKKFDKSK